MTPQFTNRWKLAYEAAWSLANSSPRHAVAAVAGARIRDRDNAFAIALRTFEHARARSWDEGKAALALHKDFRELTPGGGDWAGRIKLLRLGFALASTRPAGITANERAFAGDVAAILPWRPRVRPARAMAGSKRLRPGTTLVCQAAFAWSAGGLATFRSTVDFALTGAAARDWPVTQRVRRPDGGWMDLRQRDSEWLRPLLAPGSWAPCPLGIFVHAIRSGAPWRDSPSGYGRNAARPYGGSIYRSVLALDDLASATASPLNLDAERFEAERVRRACAGLAVINGVVWRRTSAPAAAVARLSHRPPLAGWPPIEAACWRLDDLHPFEPQATIVDEARPIVDFEFAACNGASPGLERVLKDYAGLANAALRKGAARSVDPCDAAFSWSLEALVASECPSSARLFDVDSDNDVRCLAGITRDLACDAARSFEANSQPHLRTPRPPSRGLLPTPLLSQAADLLDLGDASSAREASRKLKRFAEVRGACASASLDHSALATALARASSALRPSSAIVDEAAIAASFR